MKDNLRKQRQKANKAQRKRHPRKKRSNQAYKYPDLLFPVSGPDSTFPIDSKGFDWMAGAAASLSVTASLSGATPNEKFLVAALIPSFLKIIRESPKRDVKATVDRLLFPKATKPEDE